MEIWKLIYLNIFFEGNGFVSRRKSCPWTREWEKNIFFFNFSPKLYTHGTQNRLLIEAMPPVLDATAILFSKWCSLIPVQCPCCNLLGCIRMKSEISIDWKKWKFSNSQKKSQKLLHTLSHWLAINSCIRRSTHGSEYCEAVTVAIALQWLLK